MAISVDAEAISRRFAERSRRQRLGGVDLWVRLEGLDRQTAHAGVAGVVAGLSTDPDSSTHTAPTDGGTYLWLEVADDWRDAVAAIAAQLEAQGYAGTITVPPTSTEAELMSRTFVPAAVLGFTLDPSIEEGPRNAVGGPATRWGVGAEPQAALLAEACSWATGGAVTWAGDILKVPVTPADCVDVLDRLLSARQSMTVVELAAEPPSRDKGRDLMRRTIQLSSFGESAWSNADPAVGTHQALEDLVALMTRLAPHLDFATVGAACPGASEFHYLVSGGFSILRHRWDTFIPDAACVQLLTDRHLERARDLSAWRVEEVAPGRHLVRWERWEDWFIEPVSTGPIRPDPEALARARHDLAELIATRDVVKANKLSRRA